MTRKRSKAGAIADFGKGTVAQMHGREVVTGTSGLDWKAAERLTTKDRQVLAEKGATCEHVPTASWPWLIAQGVMRPLACTCPLGMPRVADPACPVTELHAQLETWKNEEEAANG